MKRMVIDVELIEPGDRQPLAIAKRWAAALWWPALLVASVLLAVATGTSQHANDGDPRVTVRFGGWADVAWAVGIIAALTLEARKAAVALMAWWKRR